MTKIKADDPQTLSDEEENKITDGFKVSWQTAVNLAEADNKSSKLKVYYAASCIQCGYKSF